MGRITLIWEGCVVRLLANSYFLRTLPTLHTVSSRLGPVSDYDDFYDARLTFNEDTSGPDPPGPAVTPSSTHSTLHPCLLPRTRRVAMEGKEGRNGIR